MRRLVAVVVLGVTMMAVKLARELRVTSPQGALFVLVDPVVPDGGTTSAAFVVENVSRLPVQVSSVTTFGDDAGVFAIAGPAPVMVPVGERLEYSVRFTPTGPGDFSARVVVESNDDLMPRNAELVVCARAVSALDGGVTPPCTAPEPPPLPEPMTSPQGCSTSGSGAVLALALLLATRLRPRGG